MRGQPASADRARMNYLDTTRRLERRLHLRRLLLGPSHVDVELTTQCNLSCFACHRSWGPVGPSYPRALAGESGVEDVVSDGGFMSPPIFEQAMSLGRHATSIALGGYGEPMMHPKFMEFARRVKREGKTVHMLTNGTFLTADACRELGAMDFDGIGVSIDGATQKTVRQLRGVSLDKLTNSIKLLNELKTQLGSDPQKPSIGTNFVAMQQNIHELPAFVQLCADIGVASVNVSTLTTHGVRELQEASCCEDTGVVEALCSQARKIADAHKITLCISLCLSDASDVSGCRDFFKSSFVCWSGKVLSCCMERFGVGDLNRESPHAVWNGEVLRSLRQRYYREGLQSICAGCPRA